MAQRHIDYFDADNIRLARLVWDDSLDQETILWLQHCVDTAHNEKFWALHVMGVHLEQMPIIVDPNQSQWEKFQTMLIANLNTARKSNNIDSTLISFIDTVDLLTHHSHRATMSHYLIDIEITRQIRHIRKHGSWKGGLANKVFVEKFGGDYQKDLLELAHKSDEEILSKSYSIFNSKEPRQLDQAPFGWVLISFRGRFLNEFEKYYQPSKFYRLSDEGQSILLLYWSFNLDLIDEEDKAKILLLLKLKNSDPSIVQIFKVRLTSLILNRTREEHMNENQKFFNSEETQRYKEKIRQIVLAQNPVLIDSPKLNAANEQKVLPEKSRAIRPESLVTMFENCTEEELLDYLEQNLKIELYMIPGSKRVQEVINIRAAILMLGNMYYSKNGIQAKQSRYDSLVKKLITIGTLDLNNYGEATTLLYYLGNPAIPFLKTEYLNNDLKRVDFAANKLIALKNADVINWLIRLTETHPDPRIKERGLLILKIMKSHRHLQTQNRGITKDESDRLSRELINPYLERN